MAIVTIPYDFTNGTVANAELVDANFDAFADLLNGNVGDDNVADGALTEDKLNFSPARADGLVSLYFDATSGGFTQGDYPLPQGLVDDSSSWSSGEANFMGVLSDLDSAYTAEFRGCYYTAPTTGLYQINYQLTGWIVTTEALRKDYYNTQTWVKNGETIILQAWQVISHADAILEEDGMKTITCNGIVQLTEGDSITFGATWNQIGAYYITNNLQTNPNPPGNNASIFCIRAT